MGSLRTVELDKENRKTKHTEYGKIPSEPNKDVVQLSAPHIDSYNFFLEQGLQLMPQSIQPVMFSLSTGDKITLCIQNLEVGKPKVPLTQGGSMDLNLYPKECIEAGSTYKAPLTGTLLWRVNDSCEEAVTVSLGDIPIMVKSKNCNLYGMNPTELVRHGEIVNETGGYFIINGVCRVLRLLIANRRNYPIAMIRTSWKLRDKDISEKGILIRCVASDETSTMNVLHHTTTGGVRFEIQLEREMFLIPLILALKVLVDYSDRLLYLFLIRGREQDNYYSEKVKMMMRELQEKKLYTQQKCKEYIGGTFRTKLSNTIPVWCPDEEACDYIFDNYVLIHLETSKQKFETLCMMTRKLFSFVGGECAAESVDVVSMHEASLGGFTYLQLVKEKIKDALDYVRVIILSKCKLGGQMFRLNAAVMRSALRSPFKKIGIDIQSFLATGSIGTKSKCGLMQATGLTVLLERLNRMRDLSHLRAIHRGSFFLDMKTIGPRRLTGEAWGFICPVHTPDGAPCGLLNHLAYRCVIPCESMQSSTLTQSLLELGMTPYDSMPLTHGGNYLEVVLDGCLVGYILKSNAKKFESRLRGRKISEQIYKYTEIVLIEERKKGQYPALFLITSPCRMMRPVINLEFKAKEFIGTFEQMYMIVAISPKDFKEWANTTFTHCEIEPLSMLSNIARLVPFSDCNPNPRNMYQCQMGKQTMGTPIHNWRSQTYHKLYRLQYPQVPLVRNKHYDDINMEEFCMGFNAVLAIVSYTGYDMEDAMIINKCAMERGLGHGQVYKSEFVNLYQERKGGFKKVGQITHLFKRDPSNSGLEDFLDANGLPFPGTKLTTGDPYYCVYDIDQNSYSVMKYKGEDCVVDKYSLISIESSKVEDIPQKANITLRVKRDPIIGDKFASRSGQKGVLSRLYPMEDLPFSERGITPDIIFNPHGIPSRMTAGTLIDLVGGKCAAEFGKAFDSSPFTFDDENPPFDYFGKILEKAGFNYYGEDVLYSGKDGRMMEVEIFEGIVYYQRLRHMTADKWQVRSTGPIDNITRQPIKGRKRGGAIRFGEMERDCLIAHGAAFTLKDRILDCSDLTTELVCSNCGSVLSATISGSLHHHNKRYICAQCGPDFKLQKVQMPYAFKFLITEFASFGICTKLGLEKEKEENNNQHSYPSISNHVKTENS